MVEADYDEDRRAGDQVKVQTEDIDHWRRRARPDEACYRKFLGAILTKQPAGERSTWMIRAETIAEHDRMGAALHEMHERTSGYTLPTDGCPTFVRLYEGLQALKQDVRRHIHLGNNILFPHVLSAEAESR